MNIAGVVILYNPQREVIINIQTYLNKVDVLYIIDNSHTMSASIPQIFSSHNKVVFLHDGKNEGIAKRLNEAANLAKRNKYEWLLTMDQDSYFSEKMIDQFLLCINNYKKLNEVAMFGIEHDKRLLSEKFGCSYKRAAHLITSGSLLNLSLFPTIGEFDERLFIDHVDHEYCFRAILKGFEVIQIDNISLNHSLGLVSQYRSLKNFQLTTRALHPPIRLYYMVRNYFYLNSKYSSLFKDEMLIFKKHLINRIKNNLLYNRQRLKVVRFIIKGYKDFQHNRLGKFNLH